MFTPIFLSGEYTSTSDDPGLKTGSRYLVFHSDYAADAAGNALFDSTSHLLPVFKPGSSLVEVYSPLRNIGVNIDTQSLYAQDHWSINGRWAADLGVRFEHVKSQATGGIVGIDTETVVPRLATSFDVNG